MDSALLHAARILTKLSRTELARHSKVAAKTIEDIELGAAAPNQADAHALRVALEEAGAVFLPEEGPHGIGVRLKFSRQTAKRIQVLENEGGPARDDDVL